MIPNSVTPGERENQFAVDTMRRWQQLSKSSGWVRQAAKHRQRFSEGYLPGQAKISSSAGKTKIIARRSQWAQAVLQLQGESYRLNKFRGKEANDAARDAHDLRDIDPEQSRNIISDLRRFSSQDRRDYVYPIIDPDYKKILLKCGRQVEKSQSYQALTLLEDGSTRRLEDVQVGDRLLGLSPDGSHVAAGTVSWKSERYTKPCVRIMTRQGHETIVALTHPMRTWQSWTEGDDLEVGSRLAVARQAGDFEGGGGEDDDDVILCAAMIAEGSCYGTPKFHQNTGEYLDEVIRICKRRGIRFDEQEDSRSEEARTLSFLQPEYGVDNPITERLKEWELYGAKSGDQFIPAFVYGLDKRQTALFLNRLWAGDGHCSLQDSSYHLEYDSISEQLVRGVQRLLWKFGIPTRFRRLKPEVYEGTDKYSHKLRVETADGARRFLTQVGALGKSEGLPLPEEEDENNNRDTYPQQIQWEISRIVESRRKATGKRMPRPGLRSDGLRETLKYPPSRVKLQRYIDHFRSIPEYDQAWVERLAEHLDTDLFWDEIVEIKQLGEHPCYDITVDGTDSFIADGFITHNSTLCSVLSVIEPIVHDFFRTLYVSPSSLQTRTFSNEKLQPLIQYSELVRRYWRNASCRDQVFEQSFVNGSFVFLRYAFLSADRARGIPADRLVIDELQDVLSRNIRVIEECLSHSDYRYSLYCGTPKTLENTIEEYWQYSTQTEWMVPCDRMGCRHWNFLDADCVGDDGPICKKCGHAINPGRGIWVDQSPGKPYKGFRISQLMVPWKYQDPVIWKDEIVHKLNEYDDGEFNNEVLGISYDNASKPVTRQDLVRCCWPQVKPPNIDLSDMIRDPKLQPQVMTTATFMGIDWGEGKEGKTPTGKLKKPSYTVVSIGYFWQDTIVIIFQKRYRGREADPAYVFKDVCKLAHIYNVTGIGLDRGHGWRMNGEIFRAFAETNRMVMQFQYNGNQKESAKWDELAYTFMVHRTFQMSELITDIKHQRVAFASWEYTKDIMVDAEHLYADYRRSGQGKDELYYDHTGPDDAFHSVNYVRMAGMVHQSRLLPTPGG